MVRENPLFPRYGFVWWASGDDYGRILHCDGVAGLLPSEQNPVPVSSHVIDGLRLAETVGIFDHTKPPKAGAKVEVMEGPFAGMIGKIARARAADRVRVMLKILSSLREVEVPLMALREV
jgi:transcription antitermination factor NusG